MADKLPNPVSNHVWFRGSKLLRPRIQCIHFGALIWLVLVSCGVARCQAVSVELKTKTGRNQFHVGEVILLDLLFVASTPDAYERNGGKAFPEPYPMPDTFLVEPQEGWIDPLGDYRKAFFKAMHSGHFPIAESRLSAEHVLGLEPYVFSLILNDYVRFFRPGRYILQVQDSGVTPVAAQSGAPQQLVLTSNRLELDILPADSEWQQNLLREALDALAQLQEAIDSHARSHRSSLDESCVGLRALGVPAAGTAMVDSLRNEDLFSHCSFQAGILEFPDPKFILVRLRKRFNDPDFPVTYTFFNTMAMVSLMAEGHSDHLFGPGQEKIDRRLEQQLVSVISLKRNQAKAESISTLVKTCFAAYGSDTGEFARVPREPYRLNSRVLQIATANSEQLSPGVQIILQNYRKAHGLETTLH